MPSSPLAYFLTFTTYGTWLHGRAPGSVDRRHNAVGTPFLPPDTRREQESRQTLAEEPYVLDARGRDVVLRTLVEVARHRRWKLWAAHVRTNHVHVVVSAEARPEKVMADFKAYASRRLKEDANERADRTRWTQHGSTMYLWTPEQVAARVAYVVAGQGEAMAVHDARTAQSPSEPEASATVCGRIRR
jgi:REP element-mobilizing transposase RayT